MSAQIYVGSRLRLVLTAMDVDEDDGETLMSDDIGTMTVTVWRPDGTEMDPAPAFTVTSESDAEGYIDFEEDELDQVGTWTAQAFADGYRSTPVTWTVRRNP